MNLLEQLRLSEADYKKMVGEYGETLVNTQLPLLLEKRCVILSRSIKKQSRILVVAISL